jgi:ABC-type branched-subunit amino acid transport system substrate-binding protein
MSTRSLRVTVAALVASMCLGTIAACGGKEESGGEQGDVKAGPGVAAKTINLGILTDLSGTFAALGKPILQATQLYWKQQNANGGVCGRQVNLVVKDHGYNPQRAVTQYRDVEPNIAALHQLLGSPVSVALLPTIAKDNMYTGLTAWTPALVGDPHIQITGTTYDLEMINGVDYLVEEGLLRRGDTVGHIYFEGDYGEGGLIGSKHVAARQGLKLVEQKIKATDTDMSGPVSALRRARVKAILMNTAPQQTAAAAGVAAAQGLDVPIMSSGPGFAPQLLATPAAGALKKNLYVTASLSPYSLDKPGPTQVRDAWEKAHPGAPASGVSVDFAWANAKMMTEVLTKACDNKDLSRQGIVDALHQISGEDLDGLVAGPLDYTKSGQPPSRRVYIARVDTKKPGGLNTLTPDGYESDNAKGFQPSQ